jgi:alkylation response protein AidB-like acyl-CoA dehydrogenase
MDPTDQELVNFKAEFTAWLSANKPAKPDFLLPQSFMEVGSDEQFHFLRDWQQKVYQAGYLGMAWPAEYGGGGKAQALQDIVTAEMLRQDVPFMVNTIGLNWAGPLILNMGSEDQKQAYIKRILSAEDIWCQGFSEPDNGSDLGNAQTRALADGDDYVVNGSKIWTSLGAYAKYMILLARTDPNTNTKYEGLSYFLSPMQAKGVSVSPIRKLTGEYGFVQTFFEDARIPGSCLIGKEGEGWKVAMVTLTFERGASGGQAGGHSANASKVSELLDLARSAQRGGRPAIEDPLVRDQLVQFLIEDRIIKLNALRAGIPALISERPAALPMSSKLVRSEFFRRMNQFSLTLQGANAGYFVGDPAAHEGGKWQRAYLQAFSATIGGGTSQIQRNIVGERVLGLPKD